MPEKQGAMSTTETAPPRLNQLLQATLQRMPAMAARFASTTAQAVTIEQTKSAGVLSAW